MILTHKHITSILILFILFTLIHTQQWYQHGNPHFINQQDYQRLVIKPQTRNQGVTILKFFTPWCRYCKYLKDIIDDLKAKDTWSITIYEVNCDQVNHHFCVKMGVHSFPKMKVYENGNLMDNMDGFYPYQIVRELFLKYNRTVKAPEPVPVPVPVIDLSNEETTKSQDVKGQEKHTESNFVQPQVVTPKVENHQNPKPEQAKPSQQKQEEKPVQVPLHHVQAQPQQDKPKQVKEHNTQQEKVDQPIIVDKKKPQPQKEHIQPVITKQSNTQKHHQSQIKKPQQMIQQQQNIAVVDQDIKQAQTEKKIIQQLTNKTTDTIDLTKILPGQQHIQYGKYIIYAICVFVGGYYFVQIMKAEPVSGESVKSYNNKSKQTVTHKGSNSQIPQRISIEDSQLREELHFEHPNQEQVNFNSVEVKDEDL